MKLSTAIKSLVIRLKWDSVPNDYYSCSYLAVKYPVSSNIVSSTLLYTETTAPAAPSPETITIATTTHSENNNSTTKGQGEEENYQPVTTTGEGENYQERNEDLTQMITDCSVLGGALGAVIGVMALGLVGVVLGWVLTCHKKREMAAIYKEK